MKIEWRHGPEKVALLLATLAGLGDNDPSIARLSTQAKRKLVRDLDTLAGLEKRGKLHLRSAVLGNSFLWDLRAQSIA